MWRDCWLASMICEMINCEPNYLYSYDRSDTKGAKLAPTLYVDAGPDQTKLQLQTFHNLRLSVDTFRYLQL